MFVKFAEDMKVKFLLVGKTVGEYLREGIALYQERIRHYVPFEIVEIPELKGVSAMSQEQIKNREGELILKNLRESDDVILLDERGKHFRSVDWARHLEQRIAHARGDIVFVTGGSYGFSKPVRGDIVFVTGGSYGFSKPVYDRAASSLSLSDMTFSHQLVRLIFVEQLYRAFTIMRGEPYHHE